MKNRRKDTKIEKKNDEDLEVAVMSLAEPVNKKYFPSDKDRKGNKVVIGLIFFDFFLIHWTCIDVSNISQVSIHSN